MCKSNKNTEEHRKKLEGIINTKNLTDEQIATVSYEFDKILNKQNHKCFNCKEFEMNNYKIPEIYYSIKDYAENLAKALSTVMSFGQTIRILVQNHHIKIYNFEHGTIVKIDNNEEFEVNYLVPIKQVKSNT